MKKALIIVDAQNDFLPGGSLAVSKGDEIIPVINKLAAQKWDAIICTQDWHPSDHKSFASNHEDKNVYDVIDLNGVEQTLWPNHCVQMTSGAELAEKLKLPKDKVIVRKGMNPEVDSYSGFKDNAASQKTDLLEILQIFKIDTVYITGLATDYCVKFTALDAIDLGFKTFLVVPGCRGVNINPGDSDKAIKEMADSGVVICKSDQI
jgi:nicotinamidase/pyrazinamidase